MNLCRKGISTKEVIIIKNKNKSLNEFLNINGRICLFYSLAWGVVAIVFNYLLFPMVKNFLSFVSSKIPLKLQVIAINLCSMIFIIDVLYSFIQYSSI